MTGTGSPRGITGADSRRGRDGRGSVGGATKLRPPLARAGVALVAAVQAEVGIWGVLAPHSFYASFPGGGHHWVSAMGPYDEHLVRDFAAMELGLAVLLICAAVWFERRLMVVAGASFCAATIPHFAYHLTTTTMLPAADEVASLASFVIELALVVAAMAVAARPPSTPPEPNPTQPEPNPIQPERSPTWHA